MQKELFVLAIHQYMNGNYYELVKQIIAETQKKGCFEEAHQLAQWLIHQENMSHEKNILTFMRIMQADFFVIRDGISPAIKISFWLNVMNECSTHEKRKELFISAWKVFSQSFNVTRDYHFLFERQMSQYKNCKTAQFKYGTKSLATVGMGALEAKDDFSQALVREMCLRLWNRDKEWKKDLVEEQHKAGLTGSLTRSSPAKLALSFAEVKVAEDSSKNTLPPTKPLFVTLHVFEPEDSDYEFVTLPTGEVEDDFDNTILCGSRVIKNHF